MGVVDLVSHGFSDEEAIIALERSGSDVTAALVLLLQRLTPEAEHEMSPCEESGVEDEAVALTAIYGEAFKLESLDGNVLCLCLKLPELEPLPGELRLFVPPGGAYPSEPCLPLFVPQKNDAHTLNAPGVRVSLAKALAEQATRLAADGSPACYELTTWLSRAQTRSEGRRRRWPS